MRTEYFNEVLSFKNHPTLNKQWMKFINNLPDSQKVAARLPDIKYYFFTIYLML